MIKKILVPTDFSKIAHYALDFAYEIAKKANAEILLAHVVEVPSGSYVNVTGEIQVDDMSNVYIMKLLEQSKKRIATIAKSTDYKDVVFHTEVEVGSPFAKLSSILSNHEVDLIVMGTMGSSGLDEVFVGSNAERVVRNAHCPVISIKTATNLADIKNIVFASDLTGEHEAVVKQIKVLLDVTGAQLHLLKVNTPSNFIPSRVIKNNLEKFKAKYNLENATINIYSEVDEEDGIVYFAEEHKMDMIAMATRGRTGLMHLLSGSIAEDVVNHAKRPVWTFKNRK